MSTTERSKAAVEPSSESGEALSWTKALLWAVGIFAYFVLTTTWLPSAVLRVSAVAGSAQLLRELIGSGIWAVFLGIGLWGLRQLQEAGRI
jgi:hypothetical protein